MRSVTRWLAILLIAAACRDSGLTDPVGNRPLGDPRTAIAPTNNPACSVHWNNAAGGSWLVVTNWSPNGVPGAGASVCIDALGSYIVTLDPAVDATPIDIGALTIGGTNVNATVRIQGTEATLNITNGIAIETGSTLDLRTSGAGVIDPVGTITNRGTLLSMAPCGGCGQNHRIDADIINEGTWTTNGAKLTLSKIGGAYQNTGTISIPGSGLLEIAATAGSAEFSQAGGNVTSGALGRLIQRTGTYKLNGGTLEQRSAVNQKPIVVLEGADLEIAASATGASKLAVVAQSTATRTVTGNIPAAMELWLGGSSDAQPATINLAGNPVNSGRLVLVKSLDATGGTLTIGGSGRLTNNGTIDQSENSGGAPVFNYAIEVTNNATFTAANAHTTALNKPGGSYINNGTIDMGPTSSVFVLSIQGSTLTHSAAATITGGTVRPDAGGRLVAAGTINSHLRPINGGIVDPGQSPGTLNVFTFSPGVGGVLRVELGGEIPGSGYDQLHMQTGVLVAGTLDIVEVNGFQAGKCGQSFTVLTHFFGSSAGKFATINGLNPAPGRMLRAIYSANFAPAQNSLSLVGFDATQKVCVGPNPVNLLEGGAGAQIAVALDHAPTANVVVNITPNAQVTVSPSSVTFTPANWELPQFYTVTAVDDQAQEGAHTGSVSHAVVTGDATFSGFVPSALTANITDNDINQAPVATNDAATTTEDTPVVVQVRQNDSDPEGQTLTVTNASAGGHGTTQITNGGTTVTYTPAANYNGSDAFTYTISDGSQTAQATVNVTVQPIPDSPNAVSDQAQGNMGSQIVITVLANDSDPDGNALTVASVTQPANGTATLNANGTVTYQSAAGFAGQNQFTYTISDGTGRTASATVTVTVIDPNANRAPLAVNDAVQLTQASMRIDVLANDSDPDGDAIRIISVSGASAGLVFISNGAIQYIRLNPAAGSDRFTYTIQDSRGRTAQATVTVTWGSGSDLRIYDLQTVGSEIRRAGGIPVSLSVVNNSNIGNAPMNVPFVAEYTLPPGAFNIGGAPGTGTSPRTPAANCSIVGGSPIRYRCTLTRTVTWVQANASVFYSMPAGSTSFAITVTVTLAGDPNTANNTLTTQIPADCYQGSLNTIFACRKLGS